MALLLTLALTRVLRASRGALLAAGLLLGFANLLKPEA